MKVKFKQDKYRKSRGGNSKLLVISCAGCGEHLFDYQKDGPGTLKRTYLDRIRNSEKFENLAHFELKEIPQLICSNCQKRIGVPMVYKKENRLAFRILEGSASKQNIRLDKCKK